MRVAGLLETGAVEMGDRFIELPLRAVELRTVRVEVGRGSDGIERLPRLSDGGLGVALRIALLVVPEPPARSGEQEKNHDQPDLFETLDRDQIPVDIDAALLPVLGHGRRAEL